MYDYDSATAALKHRPNERAPTFIGAAFLSLGKTFDGKLSSAATVVAPP
jgi:hypothetical protein